MRDFITNVPGVSGAFYLLALSCLIVFVFEIIWYKLLKPLFEFLGWTKIREITCWEDYVDRYDRPVQTLILTFCSPLPHKKIKQCNCIV